jgi:hypothetical protein
MATTCRNMSGWIWNTVINPPVSWRICCLFYNDIIPSRNSNQKAQQGKQLFHRSSYILFPIIHSCRYGTCKWTTSSVSVWIGHLGPAALAALHLFSFLLAVKAKGRQAVRHNLPSSVLSADKAVWSCSSRHVISTNVPTEYPHNTSHTHPPTHIHSHTPMPSLYVPFNGLQGAQFTFRVKLYNVME